MKHLFSILAFLTLVNEITYAQRIKGGWIECSHFYDKPLEKTSTYYIEVHVFGSGGYDVLVECFSLANGALVFQKRVTAIDSYFYNATNQFSNCPGTASLNNVYNVRNAPAEITVPTSPDGYFVTADLVPSSTQIIARDTTIRNIYDPGGTGILLSTNIPGTINGIDYHKNNPPVFKLTDTITVCKNTYFSSQCIITDADGDSLAYYFGDAIQMAFDTTAPPLSPVQYQGIYSAQQPLGPGVTIDSATGFLSGVAPGVPGGYNIAVYVQEWRNGVLINTTRKESQIKVVDCPFKKPLLQPAYSQCRVNTFTFKTEPTCPAITDYFWDFGNPNSLADTSVLPLPSYTYPPGPGTYTLKLKIKGTNGYFDSAISVVKILDAITVTLRPDTAICSTDTIQLLPVSDGSIYRWRESGGGTTLSNYNIKNPTAFPLNSTVYTVIAQLNNCFDSTQIIVHASPYPKANAGSDTVICSGESTTLQGQISGAYFTWSPTATLTNSHTLQPLARPQKNTLYVLTARDTLNCPKIAQDVVYIKVIPDFTADAGNNANIVYGQPYQLQATTIGNTETVRYQWTPAAYLSNSTAQSPTATITNTALNSIRYKLTATTVTGNCSATDEVVLHLFKTSPDILVPSGFTPNGDGKNDVLKPIIIGIQQFQLFSLYNRHGQLVFTTTQTDKGWDGKLNGEPQLTGSYVYVAKGIDYTGKPIERKGTVVLIR